MTEPRRSDPIVSEFESLHRELTEVGSPFEMESVDVNGRTLRTWKHAPVTLRQLIDRSSDRGDLEYLVYGQERWSYEQHLIAVGHLAHDLREGFGIRPGDRVAIAMRNSPEWSVAFWAAAAIGAVAVPLNAWWTGPELAFGVVDSASALVICDFERWVRLRAAGVEVPILVAREIEGDLSDGALALNLRMDDPATPLPDVVINPEDEATLMYTSGTTGVPKGVLGSHRNICSSVTSLTFVAMRDRRRADLPPSDVTRPATALVAVPFFHATGLHGFVVGTMAAGNRMVLMHKWDAAEALRIIEAELVTVFSAVPAMVRQLVDHPSASDHDLSSLSGITSGGAPSPPGLVKMVTQRLDQVNVRNGYGLTETSTVVTMNSGPDHLAHPDSVGVSIPVCDVKVVDDRGAEVNEGEVGELLIRGPNVVRGYWRRPEATAESFDPDGWFHSGDLGRIRNGFVYIVDRVKDIIIRGGENISSVEVEAALFEHPDVADVAVIPIPHDVLGEEVGAVVQSRPDATVDPMALRAFIVDRLAGFKVPAHIWISDEPLPRNPQGKVLKQELRTHYGVTTP